MSLGEILPEGMEGKDALLAKFGGQDGIEKLAHLMLFLKQRDSQRGAPPCWKTLKCSDKLRSSCFAALHRAGEYCWLVTGNYWRGRKMPCWEAKLAKCRQCPVLKRWTSTNGDGG